MAKFEMTLPEEIIKDLDLVYKNTDKMLGEMTQAGAEVVVSNIKANAPEAIRKSTIYQKLKTSKIYKTPTDDGINTKAAFFFGNGDDGYFINKKGKKTPIPLVLNMFEFGSSKRNYPKHPFIRKSFKKNQIETAMKNVQKKYLKGTILDNE